MSDSIGVSVEIFMPKGQRDGLRTIEQADWTGKGVAFPRRLLSEAKERSESSHAGIYILWGNSENYALPKVYVGESDNIRKQLDTHANDSDKTFWQHTVLFTGKEHSLNSTHAKHIVVRLYDMALKANRCTLANQQKPQSPSLSEVDQARAERFLSNLLFCLSAVGVDFFDESHTPSNDTPVRITKDPADEIEAANPKPQETTAIEPATPDIEILYIKNEKKDVQASGYFLGNNFVVMAGSQATKDLASYARNDPRFKSIPERRNELIRIGVLQEHPTNYEFTMDYQFNTPSAASSAVLGATSNGWEDWKNSAGQPLREVRTKTNEADTSAETEEPMSLSQDMRDFYRIVRSGIEAYGYPVGDDFVVKAKSQATKSLRRSALNPRHKNASERRKELIDKGILKDKGDYYEFVEDYTFTPMRSGSTAASPAASVILGSPSNGLQEWKDKNDKPLKENQQIEAPTARRVPNLQACMLKESQQIEAPAADIQTQVGETKDLFIETEAVYAHGYINDNGFVVTEGSQATKSEFPSAQPHVINKRKELIKRGVLQQKGDVYEFTRDYQFQTPSTASSTILGRSSNGWAEWKDENGKPLNETHQP